MIEEAITTARRGETARHLGLKGLAAQWAFEQGLSFVAPEVSFPYRRFRVDVAACAPVRKAPSRHAIPHLSSVLKAAVVFECKQVRGDLIRDNKRCTVLAERLKVLESRRHKLESLLQVHLPHLANGEGLFPEFDSYRLREHSHAGYQRLLREIRVAKRGVVEGTKFDRLLSYRVANLHYLVAEEGLIEAHELPVGWGLLVRQTDHLVAVTKPLWQHIGVEEQLMFLQRISAKKSVVED
jgi:hypothetical protein